MPIYEYKCKECDTRIEARQSVSDPPLQTCEKCGGKLEKQWSLSGFQFKGEGWYVTDYAGKKTGPADKTGGAEKSEKSSGTESTASGDAASKKTGDSTVSKDTASKTVKE